MPAFPLGPGSKGNDVKQMQLALIAKGYSVGPKGADGIFGADTLSALEAFQDNDALPVEPFCDQAAWNALGCK